MPDEEKALRFLADMGVSWRVVEWLRSQGYDAKHLRDGGLERLEDAAIFSKAREESRIVLTFDLDFGEIAALNESRVGNIVVFRLRHPRPSSQYRR